MKNIAAAMVKAQKQFGPALKTHTNPAFRSKYADLSACIEAVIDALNNNGIFLMQSSHECERGVSVETVFVHESGETISAGKLSVPAAKQDPQGYGSALTYARRYSLMAACGIAPEDDDGNAAQRKAPDAAAILRSISGAASVETLKTNFEAAMQMLDEAHHPAITKAKNARYKELTKEQQPS
jgi:hypothetical protein